jgi:putative transposase
VKCELTGRCVGQLGEESFFSSQKGERVNRRGYATRDEAKADMFDYVERFFCGDGTRRSDT